MCCKEPRSVIAKGDTWEIKDDKHLCRGWCVHGCTLQIYWFRNLQFDEFFFLFLFFISSKSVRTFSVCVPVRIICGGEWTTACISWLFWFHQVDPGKWAQVGAQFTLGTIRNKQANEHSTHTLPCLLSPFLPFPSPLSASAALHRECPEPVMLPPSCGSQLGGIEERWLHHERGFRNTCFEYKELVFWLLWVFWRLGHLY